VVLHACRRKKTDEFCRQARPDPAAGWGIRQELATPHGGKNLSWGAVKAEGMAVIFNTLLGQN
jgi:hypothetical protein